MWTNGMNPEQAEVVLHGEGPLAVFAGAGSGKTRVLCHRIGRLVADGVLPERILAVTFSKKAADEMNDRLADLGVSRARVGTWHSLAWQILREDETRFLRWAIDSKDRHKGLVKRAAGYQHVNWPGCDVSTMRRLMGICAANLWARESEEALRLARELFGAEATLALDVWRATEMLLEDAQLLTFDDMLVHAHAHLTTSLGAAERWAGRWDYLLQDEAQDANRAQVAIAELLAKGHRNYMIVGDPSQSIYSFRGSSPRYLRDFADTWRARVITMAQNYRSTGAIVRAANGAIRPSPSRLPVDLEAVRREPGSARVVSAETMDEEAALFADYVGAGRADGQSFSDHTGLFRTNAQTRALEEALLARRIPYTVVGGSLFWERKEVRDLLAYLRVAQGTGDADALKRSINAPFRFLGQRFVDRVIAAHERSTATWTNLARAVAVEEGIQRRQVASAETWANLVDLITLRIRAGVRPAELLETILRETGYIAWLEREEGAESLESSHAANVREVRRVAERFEATAELLDFVDENIAAARRERGGAGDRVLLMSVHRAKGLEWPRVWVVGCNEMILPHAKGDLDEERRIFYVAATRARDELTLSFVRTLMLRSGPAPGMPSRFLADAGLSWEVAA